MTAAPTRLLVPTIVAGLAFAVLIGLGTWQLERREWKLALIEALNQRLQAPPVALPAKERWHALSAATDEFRRVNFKAAPLLQEWALVYTVGSPLRPDVAGPGYWAFAPARLADGGLLVVNLGFIPQQHALRDRPPEASQMPTGAVEMVGYLRWPETRGLFTPRDDPARNVWYVRDHLAIAKAKNWGEVAPFYVDLELPVLSAGGPRPGALKVQLRNDHLQYALTWYGLAAVLAMMFALWARSRWRAARLVR